LIIVCSFFFSSCDKKKGHSEKKPPSVPLRSNPPRTPTMSHPINYNVNQNFSALTSALSHARTTYARGQGKVKRGKEKVAADLWVACDLCEKWRLLPPGTFESEDKIPAKWQCSMYPNSKFNDCSIPEDTTGGGVEEEGLSASSSTGSLAGAAGASPTLGAAGATAVAGGGSGGAAAAKKWENDALAVLMKKMQRRVAKNKKRLQEQAAANEQIDGILESMMQMEEPIEEEEDNEESDDVGGDDDGKRNRRKRKKRPLDPLSELLAEEAMQPREEDAIETSFVMADMALSHSSSNSPIPEFFRGRVNVMVENTLIGVLELTEKVGMEKVGRFLFSLTLLSRILCWMFGAKLVV
jgi:hypothetical protein